MKCANLLRIMISIVGVLFLAFISIGCSSARMESKKDLDVVLTTGPPGDEAVWHIKNVAQKDRYVDRNFIPKEGDAVAMEGECFFKPLLSPSGTETEDKYFVLEDLKGDQFDMQMTEAKATQANINGDEDFLIQFSLTDDGSINTSINSWSDLVIADPDDKYRDLPGHKVSLGAFDVNADS